MVQVKGERDGEGGGKEVVEWEDELYLKTVAVKTDVSLNTKVYNFLQELQGKCRKFFKTTFFESASVSFRHRAVRSQRKEASVKQLTMRKLIYNRNLKSSIAFTKVRMLTGLFHRFRNYRRTGTLKQL